MHQLPAARDEGRLELELAEQVPQHVLAEVQSGVVQSQPFQKNQIKHNQI